jgi:hypothetical protein
VSSQLYPLDPLSGGKRLVTGTFEDWEQLYETTSQFAVPGETTAQQLNAELPPTEA